MPEEPPLCPATKQAIETIARHLRTLPCGNSLVAMNLHRVARDLEAIATGHATIDACGCNRCADAPVRLPASLVAAPILLSAQKCAE